MTNDLRNILFNNKDLYNTLPLLLNISILE